jgi:RimJ/RimL family protein N-acetyltransferase
MHAAGAPAMPVLETERLILRRLESGDAAFILELLNEPAWLRFIGDKHVHDLAAARAYIEKGPMEMYARLGFGLYRVELKEGGTPIGLCGLIRRDTLPDADIGFAFLARHHGKGYGRESAAAVLEQGRREFGLTRILAITSPDNHASIRLLEKLGFVFERMLRLSADAAEVKVFAHAA